LADAANAVEAGAVAAERRWRIGSRACCSGWASAARAPCAVPPAIHTRLVVVLESVATGSGYAARSAERRIEPWRTSGALTVDVTVAQKTVGTLATRPATVGVGFVTIPERVIAGRRQGHAILQSKDAGCAHGGLTHEAAARGGNFDVAPVYP